MSRVLIEFVEIIGLARLINYLSSSITLLRVSEVILLSINKEVMVMIILLLILILQLIRKLKQSKQRKNHLKINSHNMQEIIIENVWITTPLIYKN